MKKLKWKLRTYDDIDYDDINVGMLLRDMLKYRGIKNPEEWLTVSQEDENDPPLLKNIEKAARLLDDAVANKWRIYLQVDV